MLCLVAVLQGPRSADIAFRSRMIDPGASETAAVADINRDGRLDIISGEYWYEAPAWRAHRFREIEFRQPVPRQFQRPADRRQRRRLRGHRVGLLVREEDGVVEEPRPRSARAAWKESIDSRGFPSSSPSSPTSTTTARPSRVVAQENGTGQAWYEVRERRVGRARRQRPELRSWHRRRRRQWRRPRRHPDAARLARGAGGSARAPNGRFTRRGKIKCASRRRRAPPAGATAGQARPPRVAARLPARRWTSTATAGNDVLTADGHDYGVFWLEQGAE